MSGEYIQIRSPRPSRGLWTARPCVTLRRRSVEWGHLMALTIYERNGGFPRIRTLVSDFYDEILESPVLAHHFENVDMPRPMDHQTRFIAFLAGSPATWRSRGCPSRAATTPRTSPGSRCACAATRSAVTPPTGTPGWHGSGSTRVRSWARSSGYVYDIFGLGVNLAARMESLPGSMQITVTKETLDLIGDELVCSEWGEFDVKGFGARTLYTLDSEVGRT